MNIKKIEFDLDFSTLGNMNCIGRTKQGDAEVVQFVMNLINYKEDFIVDENSQFIMYGTKNDGTKICNSCEYAGENKIIYTLHSQDTTSPGLVYYQLVISSVCESTVRKIVSPKFPFCIGNEMINPEYKLLEEQPEDWEENYNDYYRLTEGYYFKLNESQAPPFEKNMYYVCTGIIESSDEFDALTVALHKAERFSKKCESLDEQIAVEVSDYLRDNKKILNYITPQMFGAKADGVTDDTTAIQTALNQGGVVYFPSGRYKVTKQLNALKPCKIVMDGFYPSSYDGGDYPTTDYNTEHGARIETYSTDGIGLLLGDCVEVDGLAIRAMEGFSGVILKYDGSQGIRTYPSQVRLQHIRVDRQNTAGEVVESFFDFNPYRTCGVIVNDVVLGSNHIAQFCEYGFRCKLEHWATSIRLSNIVVDTYSHFPLYLNGNEKIASNWVIANVAIQTYSFEAEWCKGLIERHICGAFISGIDELFITGCKMWDVNTTAFGDCVIRYVETGVDSKVTAIGNDNYFDSLDTEANKLNISALTSNVTANEETGGNTITLSDGTHTHNIDLPAVSISDEQIGNSVGEWMDKNAEPKEVVGKNKLNPAEAEDGGLNASGLENSGDTSYFWRTGSVEVKKGDVVRFFYNTGTAVGLRNMAKMYEYDENMNFISCNTTVASSYTIVNENAKYFRAVISKSGTYGIAYENTGQCMITINNPDTEWADYEITLEGGLGEYLMSSPEISKIIPVEVSGDLTVTGDVYPDYINYARYKSIKTGDIVYCFIDVSFKAITTYAYLTLSGLPYTNEIQLRDFAATSNLTRILWSIPSNSKTLTIINNSSGSYQDNETASFVIIYKTNS